MRQTVAEGGVLKDLFPAVVQRHRDAGEPAGVSVGADAAARAEEQRAPQVGAILRGDADRLKAAVPHQQQPADVDAALDAGVVSEMLRLAE